MESSLLTDIVVVLGASVVALFVCYRLRLPAVVGFLTAGMVVGPYGPGLIRDTHEVEVLAEVGVVLLLFAIGLEFSLRELARMRRLALVGGLAQVGLTCGAGLLIAGQVGLPVPAAVVVGFLLALSSTAVVMRLLQERGEAESAHGRAALGVLIFQDLIVIPMMLALPLLAGGAGKASGLFALKAQSAVVIVAVLVGAIWMVPRLLHQVVGTRSRELFLLTIVGICAGVAFLTAQLGLSLALGAFFAGLLISESEYSQQALGDVLPFRDVFAGFFFVSVGMLLDTSFVVEHWGTILLLTAGTLALKGGLAQVAGLLAGLPLRAALLLGTAVSQVGEFSFVLAGAAMAAGLVDGAAYQYFLAVAILTMAATPLMLALGGPLADGAARLPLLRRLPWGGRPTEAAEEELRDHLIIVGYGVNGRNVARAARHARVTYVVLDSNPETVRQERAAGEPIQFGDAANEAVLEHAGIRRARVLVAAIADAAATRRLVALARLLNPNLYLIARSRFLGEVPALRALGADEVIPEEFETSVEIFVRVLSRYLVPRQEIERLVEEIRAEGYEMLRTPAREAASLGGLRLALADLTVAVLQVEAHSPMVGGSLGELGLRQQYAVSVLAVRRGGELITNPAGELRLQEGDVVAVLGRPEDLSRLREACRCEDAL